MSDTVNGNVNFRLSAQDAELARTISAAQAEFAKLGKAAADAAAEAVRGSQEAAKASKAATDQARAAAEATAKLAGITKRANADTLTDVQRLVAAYREEQTRIEALAKAGADAATVEQARQATMGRLQRDLAGVATASADAAKTTATMAGKVGTVATASGITAKQLLNLKLVLSERLAPALNMISPAAGGALMGLGRLASFASVLGPAIVPLGLAAAAGATAWTVYGAATADAAGRAKGLADNLAQVQKGLDPKILEAAAEATRGMADGFRDLETELLVLSGDLDAFEVQALDRIANLQAESEARRYAAGMLVKQAYAEKLLIEVQNQGLGLSMKEREANVARIHALEDTIATSRRAMDAVEAENDAAMDRLTTLLLDVKAKKDETAARNTNAGRVKTDTDNAKAEAEALAALVYQNRLLLRAWQANTEADVAGDLGTISDAYDEIAASLAEVEVALAAYQDRLEGVTLSDLSGVEDTLSAVKGGVTGIMAQFGPQGQMAAAVTEFIMAPRKFAANLTQQLDKLADPKTYARVEKVLIRLMEKVPDMLPRIVEALVDGLIGAATDPAFWLAVAKMNAKLFYEMTVGLSVAAIKAIINAVPALVETLEAGLRAVFSLDFWRDALRGFGQYVRDIFKEITSFGRAETKTFGDTPGPVRVSSGGLSARFSPGDTVIAARNEGALLAQALDAVASRLAPAPALAAAGAGGGVSRYGAMHRAYEGFMRDHRQASRPTATGRRV